MRLIYIVIFAIFQYSLFSITIQVTEINNYPLKLQFNLEAGVSVEGKVNAKTGRMDYNTIFLKPSFYIDKFGIGFDLKFRFSRFPELLTFNERDWNINEDTNKLMYSLIDKLDFLRFGSKKYPIYFKTGTIPTISAGSGLLINTMNNVTFSPGFKEHGVYSVFNGMLFEYPIPFKGYFFMPDIADPDIIIAGGTLDASYFINSDFFSINTGFYTAIDFDSTESNFFSAQSLDEIEYYRNTDFNNHTMGFTFPAESKFDFNIAQLRVLSETSFILKNKTETTLDGAQFFGIRGDFVQLENSGYLVGIPFGITIKSNGFYSGYFSSNYQITRKNQFENQHDYNNFFFNYGFYLTAFDDTIVFSLLLYSPFTMEYFTAGYEGTFHFDGESSGLMKGLDIDIKYRSSLESLNINGDGGFFLYTITKDFRFSIEIGYNIYSTRISLLAGVQRAHWVSSVFNDFKYDYTFENEYGIDQVYSTIVVTDNYGKMLDKFMRLEVSFAF